MLTILTDVSLIITTIVTGVIIYYKWCFQHWKKRNIPSANASIPFGSLKNPIFEPESLGHLYERLYKEHKAAGCKHVGLFTFSRPIYMPIDLEITKNILSKNFDHFVDRGFYYNEKDDPLSAHIFALEGTKWKNLRAKLTPAFSSGKLKTLYPLIVHHAQQLEEAIDEEVSAGKAIDVKTMMSNYSTDIIGSTAFGLDCNSFKSPNSEYRKNVERFFEHTKFEAAKFMIFINNHSLGRFLKYCITPKEVADFFMKKIKETVNYRESTRFKRNDFMQILIELKNNPDSNVNLTFHELAAQAFAFFVASTETTYTTLSFCMYELAKNENIQEKIREEVKAVLRRHGKELTYESLTELKYMQQVIDETLRKYPAAPFLFRKCIKDYELPRTSIVLEKGSDVVVSLLGLHHDEEFFPNHEKFDPERFNEINKTKLPSYCYIPYGEGPRICIGVRFALMEIKTGIAALLKNYKFSLNEKTPERLTMSPFTPSLASSDEILLNAMKLV